MEIIELIRVFKALLPIYQKAFNENYSYKELYHANLENGICKLTFQNLNLKVYEVFSNYYKYYINKNGYLFPTPQKGKDLKKRINFMETEIKDLNKLLKKGYTHV